MKPKIQAVEVLPEPWLTVLKVIVALACVGMIAAFVLKARKPKKKE